MKKIAQALIITGAFAFASSALAEKVDLSKSYFQWIGTKKIAGSHTGKIKLKSASISGNKGKFVIDMNSMTVEDDAWGKKADLLAHLKNADFFDVKKFPTATFVINSVENNMAKGQLTIKGITKDVTVPFVKSGKSYSGTLSFDRTEFNVKYNSANFFKKLADSKIISNTVNVPFVVFTK